MLRTFGAKEAFVEDELPDVPGDAEIAVRVQVGAQGRRGSRAVPKPSQRDVWAERLRVRSSAERAEGRVDPAMQGFQHRFCLGASDEHARPPCRREDAEAAEVEAEKARSDVRQRLRQRAYCRRLDLAQEPKRQVILFRRDPADVERVIVEGHQRVLGRFRQVEGNKQTGHDSRKPGRLMTITFWGVRGSLPVPGPHTLRYGGNTACVSVEVGGKVLVLDAGTGIFELGRTLLGAEKDIFVLLSHLHSDHTQGLPFFAPLYEPAGPIYLLDYEWDGEVWSPLTLFDGVYHPLRKDMLPPECLRVRGDALAHLAAHGFMVERIALNHGSGAYGYRITHEERTFVYMTDNELITTDGADVQAGPHLAPIPFERFVAFCAGADVLCHDAQYRADEMPLRRGWGHSQLPDVCRLAEAAGVKHLVLFHHDPLRTDEAVGALLHEARARLEPSGIACTAAYEGLVL